jgi:AraC-like DNA-binding protein
VAERPCWVENDNRRLLRARDRIDRDYARPLRLAELAATAHMSQAHFSRLFRSAFGESPHRYLQRRRIERAMFLLRNTDRPVTDVCFEVGFGSLGTFSRTFRVIVGESPSDFRHRAPTPAAVPTCFARIWTRPADTVPAAGPGGRPPDASRNGEVEPG